MKTNNYAMGYSDTFVTMLKQRKVETHAQFLLPYLKPGIKMLDCGCGPGSLTIGFARYVKNGEIVGVDIEESQLQIARDDAKNAGINNVLFKQASILDLPFEDNYFDVVFSHAVLSHLHDPIKALKEQKRVVKPGGIVAARNGYHSGTVFYPKNPLLEEAVRFSLQPARDSGGDPDLGLRLGELFRIAGLKNVKQTVTCSTSDIRQLARSFADEILERDYNKKALASGKITLEKLQQYRQAWLDFADDSNSFSYNPWCEAVGFK